MTSFEGILKDDQGRALHVFSRFVGIESNNAIYVPVLEYGLRVVISKGLTKIVIEGDSQIIVSMVKKLQNVTTPSKEAKS